MSFDRLIRFLDQDGKPSYGNLSKDVDVKSIEGSDVQMVFGNIDDGFRITSEKAHVMKVCFESHPNRAS